MLYSLAGFAVGSIDGRVALKRLNPSNSNDMGLVLRDLFVGHLPLRLNENLIIAVLIRSL